MRGERKSEIGGSSKGLEKSAESFLLEATAEETGKSSEGREGCWLLVQCYWGITPSRNKDAAVRDGVAMYRILCWGSGRYPERKK